MIDNTKDCIFELNEAVLFWYFPFILFYFIESGESLEEKFLESGDCNCESTQITVYDFSTERIFFSGLELIVMFCTWADWDTLDAISWSPIKNVLGGLFDFASENHR